MISSGMKNVGMSNAQLVTKYHELLKIVDENMCVTVCNAKRLNAGNQLQAVMAEIDRRSVAITGVPVEWYSPTGETIFPEKFIEQLKKDGTI